MTAQGANVTLRPAMIADREAAFRWMAQSDLTARMMGPPDFPECPVPDYEQFCSDFVEHFWDGSAPQMGRSFIIVANGEDVGHCNHDVIDPKRRSTELDVWLASSAVTGKGYGTAGLRLLCEYLHETFGVIEFVIRPSARNRAAVRSYQKAGFETIEPDPELAGTYPPGDYDDTVFMVKRIASG